jgi:hypothetical protein
MVWRNGGAAARLRDRNDILPQGAGPAPYPSILDASGTAGRGPDGREVLSDRLTRSGNVDPRVGVVRDVGGTTNL